MKTIGLLLAIGTIFFGIVYGPGLQARYHVEAFCSEIVIGESLDDFVAKVVRSEFFWAIREIDETGKLVGTHGLDPRDQHNIIPRDASNMGLQNGKLEAWSLTSSPTQTACSIVFRNRRVVSRETVNHAL